MLKWTVLTLLVSGAVAHAATTERLSVVAGGETVGHVVAVRSGTTVDIDYAVLENGRGPKHQEHIVFGAAGMPVLWTIEGTSLMGGVVSERMSWQDGVQRWSSQADNGEVQTAAPMLYIANDSSPWLLGLYAALLRKAPGGALEVLPSGTLRAQRVRHLSAQGRFSTSLDAYVLSGIGLTPQFLLLDSHARLYAVMSEGSVVVRQGFEHEYKALQDLDEDLTLELLRAMQKKVAHVYEQPIRIRNVHVFDPLARRPARAVAGGVSRPHRQRGGRVGGAARADGRGRDRRAGRHGRRRPARHARAQLPVDRPFYLAAGVTRTRDVGNYNAYLLDLIGGSRPVGCRGPTGFRRGSSRAAVNTPTGADALPTRSRIDCATCAGTPGTATG